MWQLSLCLLSFFFNDTATTEIYTLSLHDALPICASCRPDNKPPVSDVLASQNGLRSEEHTSEPSHVSISYAVFCLKKKIQLQRGAEQLKITKIEHVRLDASQRY